MRKVFLFIGMIVCATTVVVATQAPQKVEKLKNVRTIQAKKDIMLTYAGVKFSVPAGQQIVLGKNKEKAVIIRAEKIENIQVGPATLVSHKPAVIAVQPQNVFTVIEGEGVQLTDANGRVANLSQGISMSGNDIRESLEEPTLPPAERLAPIHPRRLAEMAAEQAKLNQEQSKKK